MTPVEKSVLKTILYSDIFEFPLTKEEIWKFLISDRKIKKGLFEKINFKKFLSEGSGYYCMKGKEKSILKRKKSFYQVEKKMKIARRASSYLSCIPSILFIGVSGGVAARDVNSGDDIDLFIIARRGTVFTTRFFIYLILEALNMRRKRNSKHVKNMICVNFILDERKMRFPREKHDLFIAREIAQLRPLFERNKMYLNFLKSNSWIVSLCPNSLEKIEEIPEKRREYVIFYILDKIINFSPLRHMIGALQKKYMENHMSGETVTDEVLSFHPNDYRTMFLDKLSAKFTELSLLTKI